MSVSSSLRHARNASLVTLIPATRDRATVRLLASGEQGCAACAGAGTRADAQPAPRERWVRAGLAALGVAFAGGWLAAEYVDTQYFATIAPGLVGLACAWAAFAAARSVPAALAVGAIAGLLATGLSFRLVPGGQNLFEPVGHRLPPYVGALVGVAAWRVLFGPVRRREPG